MVCYQNLHNKSFFPSNFVHRLTYSLDVFLMAVSQVSSWYGDFFARMFFEVVNVVVLEIKRLIFSHSVVTTTTVPSIYQSSRCYVRVNECGHPLEKLKYSATFKLSTKPFLFPPQCFNQAQM